MHRHPTARSSLRAGTYHVRQLYAWNMDSYPIRKARIPASRCWPNTSKRSDSPSTQQLYVTGWSITTATAQNLLTSAELQASISTQTSQHRQMSFMSRSRRLTLRRRQSNMTSRQRLRLAGLGSSLLPEPRFEAQRCQKHNTTTLPSHTTCCKSSNPIGQSLTATDVMSLLQNIIIGTYCEV